MFAPLTDVRVVDLTQILAGPYATYQLALLGAEVIKVELPGVGDWTRRGGEAPELAAAGMGLAYLTQNANKRSVTLDLKEREDLKRLQALITTADVFVENFTPGVAARLGLSFEAVKAIRPDVVYCSISAYGQDGPLAGRSAYDHVVQGMCGIMTTTGTEDGGPCKVGAPYIDYATGLNGAFAIVSALHQVRRTGEAVRLDVAMLDTAMLLMASLMTNHLSAGWEPAPSGNQAWSGSPSSGAFETADGILMLAANNEAQFQRLCTALERPDILRDERWSEPPARKQHAASLRSVLQRILSELPAHEWEERLNAHRVPAARVRSLAEVLAQEQLGARGITEQTAIPGHERRVHLPTLGFKVNGEAIGPTSPPPALGQDNATLLD